MQSVPSPVRHYSVPDSSHVGENQGNDDVDVGRIFATYAECLWFLGKSACPLGTSYIRKAKRIAGTCRWRLYGPTWRLCALWGWWLSGETEVKWAFDQGNSSLAKLPHLRNFLSSQGDQLDEEKEC